MRHSLVAIVAALMLQIAASGAQATSYVFVISFEHGSAELDTKALHQLVRAEQLRSQWGAGIALSGFTDRSGPTEGNKELARRRAIEVREALIRLGAPRTHIRVSTFGEVMPIKETLDGVKEPLNRRVELTFTPL